MPLEILRSDITKMAVDAIVNSVGEMLPGISGMDGCRPGRAKAAEGHDLPAKYVLHTAGPVWHGGFLGEKRVLRSCYRTSLALAKKLGCETVAVPLISAGACGYPSDKAFRVAVDAIHAFLTKNDMTVYLVVHDPSDLPVSGKLFRDVQAYIDGQYMEPRPEPCHFSQILPAAPEPEEEMELCEACPESFLWESMDPGADFAECAPRSAAAPVKPKGAKPVFQKASASPKSTLWDSAPALSLDDMLAEIDESFSEMLLRKIGEKGMKDSQCYKKANIDRKLFSKIRSDRLYKPSKPTVLAFAIALELPLDETKEMLRKAGFALSRSNKSDIIVEYFIRNGIYDIYTVNETLFAFDQSLLGG